MRSAVQGLKVRVGPQIILGGVAEAGSVRLSELVGTRTGVLRGLEVRPRAGLGGRVLVEQRPVGVADYGSSGAITHEYDRPVLAEGIRALVALPVLAADGVRALLYLGTRGAGRLSEPLIGAAQPFVRALEQEIRVRDEVDRRLAFLSAPADPTTSELMALREVQAELRELAATTTDDSVAARLRSLEGKLGGSGTSTTGAPVVLAPREIDVLALVALGYGNAEIAARLQLGVETVRSYLRNAMRKLDASTRMEAVVRARQVGALL